MKKTLLIAAFSFLTLGGLSAQTLEKNIFTVRGGVNITDIATDYTPTDSRIGFHLGATYERVLSRNLPLYLETGLMFQKTGWDYNADKTNAYSLQIPLKINYKFNLGHDLRLYPSVGVYYALGIGGKLKTGYGAEFDTYEHELKRSDFGLEFGATLTWKHLLFSVGYDLGLTDLNPYDLVAYNGSPSPVDDMRKNRNLFFSVGYKF